MDNPILTIRPNRSAYLRYEGVIDDVTVSLIDFCEDRRKVADLSIGALEEKAGLDHPSYYLVAKGKSKGSVATLALALDVLGYEFVLRKKG